jgi:hypothetical protein
MYTISDMVITAKHLDPAHTKLRFFGLASE